jgi:hypothetical protein
LRFAAAHVHIRINPHCKKNFSSRPFILQAQVSESFDQSSQIVPALERGALSRRRAAPPTLAEVRLFPDDPTD